MEEIKIIRDTGYGQVKRNIMRDKTLSIEAKAIYSYLCSFAGTGEKAYPLVKTMLEELNISKNRYYKYLKELEERKIIIINKIQTKSGMMRNIYFISDNKQYLQNEDEGSLQNEDIGSTQFEDTCIQNEDIGSLQNEDEGSLQNKDIEYKQRIITMNNNPPISPLGGEGDLKTEPTKPKREKTDDVIKEFAGEDTELFEAIKEFEKSRRLIKKPMTPRALRLNINTLKSLSSDREEQLAIIDQSIKNSWQGFFALKDDHPLKQKQKEKERQKLGIWL